MILKKIEKKYDGKYLKYYDMLYENKEGKPKIYNMVSFQELTSLDMLGTKTEGVAIAAFSKDKMLLLHEFRMAVNEEVINFCAGRIEPGETIEECARRELYEETGLKIKQIFSILPPAYAAVSLSDVLNRLIFVEVEGEISDHTTPDEQIRAKLFTRQEVRQMLETKKFSSRAQAVAWMFVMFGAEQILQACVSE